MNFTSLFSFIKRHLHTSAVVGVFLISMFIRFWHVEQIPYQTDGDELAYVFAGQSLLTFHHPVSWSSFVYPDKNTYEKKIVLGNEALNADGDFTLVTPWFDHPYLLSIIQGWNSELFGYHFPSVPPSFILRLPMLGLAGITLVMVYLISKHLFGKNGALLSLTLMGFTPSLALGQRMVVGENLFIPLMLVSLYCVLKKKHIFLPMLFIALCGLTKITGLLALPVTVLPLVLEKKYKDSLLIALGSLSMFAGLYLIYAYAHGIETFLWVMRTQSYRLLGWSNPAFILSHPGFHTSSILDLGYYVILFLGVVPFFGPVKKERIWMPLTIVGTFVFIWITGAEQDMLGWYKLPLFTFLCIFAGSAIENGISTFLPLGVWLAAVNNIGLVRYPDHPLPTTELLRAVVAFICLGTFITYLLPAKLEKKVKLNLLCLGFVFYAGVSLYTVQHMFTASCQSRFCPTPELSATGALKQLKQAMEEKFRQ